MKKTTLMLAATALVALTPDTTVAKEKEKYAPGYLVERLCDEEYPCSDLQKGFLERISKVLFDYKAKMSFANDGGSILFSDVPSVWFEIDKDINLKYCDPGAECHETGKTGDFFIDVFIESLNKRLKKQMI